VKGESVAPVERSSFSIQAFTVNYRSEARNKTPKYESWCKPLLNKYKVNNDALYFPNRLGVIAAVLRNDRGKGIAGGAWPKGNLFFNVATVEMEALRRGLHLADDLEFLG
jgi:hypothetical protein